MKVLARVSLIALIGILASSGADAFWSRAQIRIHQMITSAALEQSLYNYSANLYAFTDVNSFVTCPQDPSRCYAFSDKAIAAINDSHAAADGGVTTSVPYALPYDGRMHFDSEKLAAGYGLLQFNRAHLMALLAPQSLDPAKAQQLLGFMLHQIQDFYSHSSWVANGHTTIADFGKATSLGGTVPTFLQETSDQIGTVCNADGTQLVSVNASITTGYYADALIQPDPPPGKCNHGNFYRTGVNCVLNFVQQPTVTLGIAHDVPCFIADSDNRIYETARALAQQETTAFVQSILAELYAGNNALGFCALLGLPATTPVCAGPVTATFVYQPVAGGDSAGGIGHFTQSAAGAINQFDFVNTGNNFQYPGSFSYGLGDLASFSFDAGSTLLSLQTGVVSSTNSQFYPQLFWVTDSSGVNVGNTATQDFPSVPITTGSIELTISGAGVLRLSPTAPTITAGATNSLSAAFSVSGIAAATPGGLQWSSSNVSVATVSNGTVTGVGLGVATISATDPASGAADSVNVTVVSPYVGTYTGLMNWTLSANPTPLTFEVYAVAATQLNFDCPGACSWSFTVSGTGSSYSGVAGTALSNANISVTFTDPKTFTVSMSSSGGFGSAGGTFTRP